MMCRYFQKYTVTAIYAYFHYTNCSRMHCFIQVDIFKYEKLIGARHVNRSHWALLVKFMHSSV